VRAVERNSAGTGWWIVLEWNSLTNSGGIGSFSARISSPFSMTTSLFTNVVGEPSGRGSQTGGARFGAAYLRPQAAELHDAAGSVDKHHLAAFERNHEARLWPAPSSAKHRSEENHTPHTVFLSSLID
jgi:hypothetical protein